MAKVNVCDLHKKEGKLVEAKTYMTVKGRPDLRLDYCADCKSKVPKDMLEYVKLVYSLQGLALSDEQARDMLKK